MQCFYGTQTSSTVDIYGILEARGETRCLGGVGVYWFFIQTDHECPWPGADPENFSSRGGGSKLPTLNFNKQKKRQRGGGFSFGVKQVFILCDCLFVPLYLFDFNIASEHCVKNREGGGLGVLPKKKNWVKQWHSERHKEIIDLLHLLNRYTK